MVSGTSGLSPILLLLLNVFPWIVFISNDGYVTINNPGAYHRQADQNHYPSYYFSTVPRKGFQDGDRGASPRTLSPLHHVAMTRLSDSSPAISRKGGESDSPANRSDSGDEALGLSSGIESLKEEGTEYSPLVLLGPG